MAAPVGVHAAGGRGLAVHEAGDPLWHGRHDRFVPVSHGEWLARALSGADVRISLDDAHLTLVTGRIPAVHEWLLARF